MLPLHVLEPSLTLQIPLQGSLTINNVQLGKLRNRCGSFEHPHPTMESSPLVFNTPKQPLCIDLIDLFILWFLCWKQHTVPKMFAAYQNVRHYLIAYIARKSSNFEKKPEDALMKYEKIKSPQINIIVLIWYENPTIDCVFPQFRIYQTIDIKVYPIQNPWYSYTKSFDIRPT